MTDQTMICPKCGKKIQITAALTAQIEEKYKEESAEDTKRAIKSNDKEWEARLKDERESVEKKYKKEAEDKYKTEIKDMKEQITEKELKIDEMRKEELRLRKKERELEEQKKNIQLDMMRKLDEERAKIREEVENKNVQNNRLKELEKDRLIDTMKTELSDMKRKLEQGSQQTQGEILELDIEQTLRMKFPIDERHIIGSAKDRQNIVQ